MGGITAARGRGKDHRDEEGGGGGGGDARLLIRGGETVHYAPLHALRLMYK